MTQPPVPPAVAHNPHAAEDAGYHKTLKPRQIQMIAIGGAIGTGLFLGAGGRINTGGPGLFIVYAVCGIFVFLILRALGELVLHRPSSGSFVSYAREFMGEKAAFGFGWMYIYFWSMTAIVDVTAIAQYMHFWGPMQGVPQWLWALFALVIVLTLNLISVKLFGELEFWAAIIKIVAISLFLAIGLVFVIGRFDVDGHTPGLSTITENGGLFPTGVLPLVLVTSAVVFAYAAVELVGTAAGETENPAKIMPRAINSVIVRIAVFYVGSVILLALLLPYTVYKAGESPFVTFFSRIGVGFAGDLMNVVVLTAALSSLNAGLYSTGRIMRSMAMNGSAPKATAVMSRNGVPFGGIIVTAVVCLLGVLLNAVKPSEAFNIALDASALGVLSTWGAILLSHIFMLRKAEAGHITRPSFRQPFAPWSSYISLVFLVVVLLLMMYDSTYNIIALCIIVPCLVIGWYLARGEVNRLAAERQGFTGEYPVKAPRPMK